nr:50S ribosomal protein L18 [bacterium]
MISKPDKNELRKVRHNRVRQRISGTAERPRLNVYRSTNHIYVQIIDDLAGHTLVSASSMEADLRDQIKDLDKKGVAHLVGKRVGERAKEKGIEAVVFDRGGYLYTGRVAEVAAGAREAGLNF